MRVLSCHAEYRCRHAGACCTSGWPIPVELTLAPQLHAAVRDGALRPVGGADLPALLFPTDAPPDAPALLGRVGDRCVFFGTHGTGRCEVHAVLGHHALPLACRQFPRVTVRDPRGASVTLSHYCPTAASLLTRDATVTIVHGPGAFPASGEYTGLDVRDALPPLLRPRMLMDWASWWEFERLGVETLGAARSPRQALGVLRATVEDIRKWSPADGPLTERIVAAFGRGRPSSFAPTTHATSALVAQVLDAVPEPLRPMARWTGHTPTSPGTAVRFLAAHAFANWTAHLGQGLRSWLRSLEAAMALLDAGAGIRHADFLLRHLIEPRLFAERAAVTERE